MSDDERTEIRREDPDLPERTRAINREDEIGGAADAHGRGRKSAPTRTAAPQPGGRVARVPGSDADDASYGVRSAPLTAPVQRRADSATPAAAPLPVARERGIRRRPRIGTIVLGALAVLAFTAILVGAVLVLLALVAS